MYVLVYIAVNSQHGCKLLVYRNFRIQSLVTIGKYSLVALPLVEEFHIICQFSTLFFLILRTTKLLGILLEEIAMSAFVASYLLSLSARSFARVATCVLTQQNLTFQSACSRFIFVVEYCLGSYLDWAVFFMESRSSGCMCIWLLAFLPCFYFANTPGISVLQLVLTDCLYISYLDGIVSYCCVCQ